MKTSVRTPTTKGSNANLIWDLMHYSGNRLILSAGYLYSFESLDFNKILNSVCNIDLVVGTWQSKDPVKTAALLNALHAYIDKFAMRVKNESDEYGIQKPIINAYTVPNWHAKVALMVDTNKTSVSAAVIGSSNISNAALGLFYQNSNIEADVLICSTDGEDAQVELDLLLSHLEATFIGHLFKTY